MAPPLGRCPTGRVLARDLVLLAPEDQIHLGLRLRHTNAGPQAPEYPNPHRAVVAHPLARRLIVGRLDGPPDFRTVSNIETEKAGRRDADDAQRRVVNRHLPANHCQIEAEPPPPEFVTNDCAGLGCCRIVIRLSERAAHYCAHPEHGEEVAGDALLLDRLNSAAARLVYYQPTVPHVAPGYDAGEGLVVVADHLVERIVEA